MLIYLGALPMQLHRHCAYFTFPGDVLTVTAGDCEFLFFLGRPSLSVALVVVLFCKLSFTASFYNCYY